MRSIVAVLVLAALASAAVYTDSFNSFRQWQKAHGKQYTLEEEGRRFAVYKENLAVIERLNLEEHGAWFGPNQFTDLTNAEFAQMMTAKLESAPADFEVVPDKRTADEADYTYMLPAVKNQAQCGSCWAFSAVANMEGQYYKQNQKVLSLSEQQLVSCDKSNAGCNGGDMHQADLYAIKNGMASEAAYPYTSGTGVVSACKSFTVVAEFSSSKKFGRVSSDDTIIAYLEQYGPLSVGIEADKPVFQSYKSGVLDSTACGTSLDHGVTLVGYGTDESTSKPFWIVRNSWGATWGEKGYIRMVRGKNMCGINADLSTIIA